MRALICDAFGPLESLRLGEMADPMPAPGEVLIDIACAGASFADALVIQGKHVARPPFPFVPGGEAAGVITDVGAGVTRWQAGDRVVAFASRGAFADRIAVAQSRVFVLPSKITFEAGAASLTSYGTALHALADRADLRAGETLLVLGAAGSTGLAAIEIGRLLGARVIAAASSAEKRAMAIGKGAAVALDYAGDGFREQLRDIAPEGVDVVFDPVGGTSAEIVPRALRRRGRHLLIGFASGDFPRLAANLYLVKQASAIGVLWGEPATLSTQDANIAQIMDWLDRGQLDPAIGGIWPLARGSAALQAVMGRRISGKAIIDMSRKEDAHG
jgi:NADPH:quinone reductase